ncbi:MAG: SpoIID/LytB domain-containing protein [Candidatus Eremiobacteraeota bacterium]|nr:SpoIID/LytB domain-containing protein [Candidatus Eremiobacteraeota bacterium]
MPLFVPQAAHAQNDIDPAMASQRQSLRVLLGHGDAAAVSADRFTFDGRLYRGTFQRQDDGTILNVVDLEQYLYSVVSAEMPPSWPPAALQVQAICARTYVLQRSDPRRTYDLVPSELDQVYGGVSGETAGAIAGVDATGGAVLSFARGFASIAYSSCCGGHTESSTDAWGNVALPYLGGVPCPWCVDSPNYRWQRSLAFDMLTARLTRALPPAARVQDLRIDARDASGRARAVDVVTDLGDATVAGSLFRRSVGARAVPSLLIGSVARAPDAASALIDGNGLGHGVGLCQWGARGMALAGRAAAEILSFYFPGTDIQHLT